MVFSDKAFYDYKKDFPKGNGWSKNGFELKYTGEIIDSPNYVFKEGKYKGKSLQSIIEYCWRGIIKYIDYGLIYITKDCINSVLCSEKKLTQIKVALDSKLIFCRVVDCNDELYSKPFPCSYQGEYFIEVYEKNPQYIYGIIARAMDNKYGHNQRFYATDRVHTILGENKLKDLERIIEHLQKKLPKSENLSALTGLLDQLKYEKETAEREFYENIREQMEKDFIEECNREFNDMMEDFDAWGNIE